MPISKKTFNSVEAAANDLRELRTRRESLEAQRQRLKDDLTKGRDAAVASALAGLDVLLRDNQMKIAAAEDALAEARGDVERKRHAEAIERALARVEAAYPKVVAELRAFADLLDQTETPEARGLASHLRSQAQMLENERPRQVKIVADTARLARERPIGPR